MPAWNGNAISENKNETRTTTFCQTRKASKTKSKFPAQSVDLQ